MILFLNCASVVEVNTKSFVQNPKKYIDKDIILITNIEEIQKRPRLMIGKKVKIKGYVDYIGFRNFPYWNFILKDKQGNLIKCYETRYRIDAWIIPVMALREAQKNKDIIIVVGKLKKKDLLELDWIEYKGQKIDTDELPTSPRQFF